MVFWILQGACENNIYHTKKQIFLFLLYVRYWTYNRLTAFNSVNPFRARPPITRKCTYMYNIQCTMEKKNTQGSKIAHSNICSNASSLLWFNHLRSTQLYEVLSCRQASNYPFKLLGRPDAPPHTSRCTKVSLAYCVNIAVWNWSFLKKTIFHKHSKLIWQSFFFW